MSRTLYETLTALDPNSIEHSVGIAVAVYAIEVMERNRDKGIKLALLAARLLRNARFIETGKRPLAEMTLLLNTARPHDADDNRAIHRVRRLASEIAELNPKSDSCRRLPARRGQAADPLE